MLHDLPSGTILKAFQTGFNRIIRIVKYTHACLAAGEKNPIASGEEKISFLFRVKMFEMMLYVYHEPT
jgi:hypothetical protein